MPKMQILNNLFTCQFYMLNLMASVQMKHTFTLQQARFP